MIIQKSTKTKNQPMPYQCEICQNHSAVKKDERDITNAANNCCFEQRVQGTEASPSIRKYAPFTNSQKEIELTCKKFSHMRILKMW